MKKVNTNKIIAFAMKEAPVARCIKLLLIIMKQITVFFLDDAKLVKLKWKIHENLH